MKKKQNRLKKTSVEVMILLGIVAAAPAPYYLNKPNGAFYLQQSLSPSTIPSECIVWETPICLLSSCYPSQTMINPSSFPTSSYYLHQIEGFWRYDSQSQFEIQSQFKVTFKDLFGRDTVVDTSGQEGFNSSEISQIDPWELIDKIEMYSSTGIIKWRFQSPIWESWLGRYPGSVPLNCSTQPLFPIVGIQSYLTASGDFCGFQYAYNMCRCTQALFMLNDYTLQTWNWQPIFGPQILQFSIYNSVYQCGNSYLLSPVKTAVNGYTPVSIVTDNLLVSYPGNPDTIILNDATENGTFDVLLEVKSTQSYTLPPDYNSQYEVIQLYFYVQVVITCVCTPNFTLTSQPQSPQNYKFDDVPMTTSAIVFTDSNDCGFSPLFTFKMSDGAILPPFITTPNENSIQVTPALASIGEYTVNIFASYVLQSGASILLPTTVCIININECMPNFTLTSQPRSPLNFTENDFTITTSAIEFTDSSNCGILPSFRYEMSDGAIWPSFILITSANSMEVTPALANIGEYTVNIFASYVSQSGASILLPTTVCIININECMPNFTLTSQPEGDATNPFTFTYGVDTTLNTILPIQFTSATNCGYDPIPIYSCKMSSGATCPTNIQLNASNQIKVDNSVPGTSGLITISIHASFVSQLGEIVTLPETPWYLKFLISGCATTSFLPQTFIEKKSLVGLSTTISYAEFQNAYGPECGEQTATIMPLASWQTWTATGSHQTNDLAYNLGLDGSALTEGGTFTQSIQVFLNTYPLVTRSFTQLITIYSVALSQIADQTYTTKSSKLSIPFQIQWLPEAPRISDPAFLFVIEGIVIAKNNQTLASQVLPNSEDFYIRVLPTTIAVYNTKFENAGDYKVQYQIRFQQYPTVKPFSQTFHLKIQDFPKASASSGTINLLPNFVTPNNWPSQVTLGCGQAWVQDVPDCQDPEGGPCTQKIELAAAIMFATYDSLSKQIKIEKGLLTPDFEGDYPVKVVNSDGIEKNVRSFQLTVACKNWKPQFKTALTDQKVIVDDYPVVPRISRITNMGKVLISFSQPMNPVNPTKIGNGTFIANQVAQPALAIKIEPYDENKVIDFLWACTNYTMDSLELQLNFTDPNIISYSSPRDKIQITFLGQTDFASTNGTYVEFGYNVTNDVPAQIGEKMGQSFEFVGKAVGETGKSLLVGTFLLNLFMAGSLQTLLNQISTLQIIVHQILVNLPIPASAQIFFSFLLEIVALSIFPTDDFFDNHFEFNDPVALTATFQSVGYESKYYLRNIGSLGFYFLAYPFSLLVQLILGKFKCKLAQRIHRWMKSTLVWNYWFGLIEESYLIMVVAAMIQFLQYSADDLNPYGRLFNFGCAVFSSSVVVMFVVLVGSLLLNNFERIQKLDPVTFRYSRLFQHLKIRTNVTNRPDVWLGKHTISYPIWSLLRRLILGVTVTSMTEQPLYCLFMMNFTTLTSIILVGTQEPFKDDVRRSIDLFNEWIVLMINYHLFCLTNFVYEPTAREYLGYSMTTVTCIFLAINLGYAMTGISGNSCRRVKYWCIRRQNQRKRDKRQKQAASKIKTKKATRPKQTDIELGIPKKVAVKIKQYQMLQNVKKTFGAKTNEFDSRVEKLGSGQSSPFMIDEYPNLQQNLQPKITLEAHHITHQNKEMTQQQSLQSQIDQLQNRIQNMPKDRDIQEEKSYQLSKEQLAFQNLKISGQAQEDQIGQPKRNPKLRLNIFDSLAQKQNVVRRKPIDENDQKN